MTASLPLSKVTKETCVVSGLTVKILFFLAYIYVRQFAEAEKGIG